MNSFVHMRLTVSWCALMACSACTDSDALSRTHAAMLLADPVHLGQDYAGDVFSGEIVVRSVGDDPLRVFAVEADQRVVTGAIAWHLRRAPKVVYAG